MISPPPSFTVPDNAGRSPVRASTRFALSVPLNSGDPDDLTGFDFEN